MSQTELGNLVSASQGTVSDWERGRSQVDADRIPDLARALNVSPCAFFEEGETVSQEVQAGVSPADYLAREMASALVDMPDEELGKLTRRILERGAQN